MRNRIGWLVLVSLTGFAASGPAANGTQAPDWITAAGTEWRGMSPEARRTYLTGFLMGSALQQARAAGANDSAGLVRTLDSLRRAGFEFPFAPNVYSARVDDYYWWENHRTQPIWSALREVNRDLKRLTQRDSQ